ncbi:hypothetical protein ABZ826_19945 [Streptomyces sp. NPDC047515]|uniref:hypothetical protein n=1 Tax=Streptomyces sp. NPDC047515 TaxID=3155380 RepID=UPI00340CBB72
MPDDVADRIDAALAAEALRTTAPADVADVSRETEHSVVQKPSTESTGASDRPSGHSRAATGPGRRRAGRRRRTAVLGAALGAAVVGVSVFMLQSLQPSQEAAGLKAADRSSDSTAKSPGGFSESTLEDQVHTLLRSAATKPSSAESADTEKKAPSVEEQSTPKSDSAGAESPRRPLSAPTVSVPPCVELGIGRKTAALAMEEGLYEGTHAFLVVLPHPSDAKRVQAYVVDAACVGEKPAAKGKLLLTRAYTRP